MSEVLDRVAETREQAHRACTQAYDLAKMLIQLGKKVHINAEEAEDDRTLQQNRFYWGPCLGDISEQAVIQGQRWSKDAWHELFKRQFLGYEIKKVSVAGSKRKKVIRQIRSTAKLKVKPMAVYLEKVQAFATTDLGVRFSVARWEDYQGQLR